MSNPLTDPTGPYRPPTPHLTLARRIILAGWALFIVSLCVPLLDDQPGALAFVYSLMIPFYIVDQPSWGALGMSSFSVVNLGLISALFIGMGDRLLTRAATSLLFVLAALDTMWIAFTPQQEFTRYPAFWLWSASAVMIAVGTNVARIREKAHRAALPPAGAIGTPSDLH